MLSKNYPARLVLIRESVYVLRNFVCIICKDTDIMLVGSNALVKIKRSYAC